MRETAGRTVATAARCKNCRRGGFIGVSLGNSVGGAVEGGYLFFPLHASGAMLNPHSKSATANVGNWHTRPSPMREPLSSRCSLYLTGDSAPLFGLILGLEAGLHSAAFDKVDRRVEDHLVVRLDALAHLDLGAQVARHRYLSDMGNAVLDHGHL